MPHLTKRKRIELVMMVDYGRRLRAHEKASALFNQEHSYRPPIAKSTVSKLIAKFIVYQSVIDFPQSGRPNKNKYAPSSRGKSAFFNKAVCIRQQCQSIFCCEIV